jgi:ATP-binding cassette subfamily C protein PrsD
VLFKSLMRSGELWDATASYRRVFIAAFAVSAVLNILMLGGAFYMMLVYDSVLPSRSVPTLIGLLALLGVVYIFQGYFDTLRSSILADVANALDRQLSRRVQDAISQMRLSGRHSLAEGLIPMRDLDQIRSFLSGGVATLFDLPWMVIFILVLFALHSWLGFTTLVGAIVIFSLTVFTDRAMRRPSSRVAQIAAMRNGAADTNLRHVELLAALGMRERMQERFEVINQSYTARESGFPYKALAIWTAS